MAKNPIITGLKEAVRHARATKRDEDRSFMQGFAIAVASLARDHDQPTLAASLIAGHGFGLEDFDGVDSYDKRAIAKLFRTESALKRN